MRALGLFALALPLLPLAAAAQAEGKTKTLADCAALVASIPDITTGPKSTIEDVEGGCRASNISYGISSYTTYTVEEVTLLSPNLLKTFPTGEVFEAATLDLKGVRLQPVTHSPLQDYIFGLNAIGMDLRLAYTTDPAALTSEVEVEFSAGRLGRIALTAALSNFDNTDVDIDGITDLPGTLHQLDVTLEDRGLFVSIFAPAVLNSLFPEDEDPSGAIMVMQETAVATLSGLPETTLSPDSFIALSTFIRALPKPEGDWHVRFVSDTGLSLDRLRTGDPTAAADFIADTEIVATGEPAAR